MDEPLTLEEEQLLDEWTNGYITGHRHGRREGVAAGYREAMRLFFKERQ